MRAVVRPVIDGLCRFGFPEIHRGQHGMKEPAVGGDESGFQLQSLLEPDRVGQVQNHIGLRIQRLVQILDGHVQRFWRQAGRFQDALNFGLGIPGRAVGDHLQHAGDAEGRNENVGVRLFPGDLFQQIKRKPRVGGRQPGLIRRWIRQTGPCHEAQHGAESGFFAHDNVNNRVNRQDKRKGGKDAIQQVAKNPKRFVAADVRRRDSLEGIIMVTARYLGGYCVNSG